MDNIHTAKSLLKKLSALRATIPDDEQIFLDKLIMGMRVAKLLSDLQVQEDIAAKDSTTHQSPDLDNREPVVPKSTATKITWNNRMEIYELK